MHPWATLETRQWVVVGYMCLVMYFFWIPLESFPNILAKSQEAQNIDEDWRWSFMVSGYRNVSPDVSANIDTDWLSGTDMRGHGPDGYADCQRSHPGMEVADPACQEGVDGGTWGRSGAAEPAVGPLLVQQITDRNLCLPVSGPSRIAPQSRADTMNLKVTFPNDRGSVRLAELSRASTSVSASPGKTVIPRRSNASVTASNRPSINSASREDPSMSDSSTRSWAGDPDVSVPYCSRVLDSGSASGNISQSFRRSSAGNGDPLMPATCPASATVSGRTHIIYADSDVEMYVEKNPELILIGADSSDDEVTIRPVQSSGSVSASRGRPQKAGAGTEKRQRSRPASDIDHNRLSGTKRNKLT